MYQSWKLAKLLLSNLYNVILLAAIYLCHLYGSFFFSFQKRALLPIFKRRISLQMTGYSSWVRVIYKVFYLVMIYFEVQDRPGHIYLFEGNKEWNSSDNLTIFGKVRQFRAVLRAIWLKYQLLQVQINCWHFNCLFNWAYVQLEITTLCWLSLWLQSKYDCSLMRDPEQLVVDFNPGLMMSKHAQKWEIKVQNVLFSYLKEK